MKGSIGRRAFLAASALAAGAVVRSGSIVGARTPEIVLRGGTIIDGSGLTPYRAEVTIAGDRIAAIGERVANGALVIDVGGLHIAPGFIDMHSHSDASIAACPTADSRVRQGITTECTGNCGSSAAPGAENNVREYAADLDRIGISLNHALLVGQGTLRENAIGVVDRALTNKELREISRQLKSALRAGAFGLSTGLEYAPGRFTPAEEIHTLARIVEERDGLYASHIRNEEARLLPAIEEAIAVGRATKVRVQISHLKAAGKPHWPQMQQAIELIEAARGEGIDVMADAYPYTAYSTGLTIFLPDWALDGGHDAMMARLKSPADRARLREEVPIRVMSDPGGFELVVIGNVSAAGDRSCIGKNLREIAGMRSVEPIDALLALLEENRGDVSFVGHGMSEENVTKVLTHPLVMIGSDGRAMAPPQAGESLTQPHPRSYGTYPRILGYYVRERRALDLQNAVRKMTAMPAARLGLRDRGRIAVGMKADLVAFDTETVGERSTFEKPHAYPDGIEHVFVNGVAVIENGNHTGARPGKFLKRD